MHLSILCPTPGEGGGFDKFSCQMPHPWGQPSCQIPTMSPGPSKGIWQHILAKYCVIATSNSTECDPMPLSATATKIGKFSTSMSTAPGVLMSNPHLKCGDAGGGSGAWNWQVHYELTSKMCLLRFWQVSVFCAIFFSFFFMGMVVFFFM